MAEFGTNTFVNLSVGSNVLDIADEDIVVRSGQGNRTTRELGDVTWDAYSSPGNIRIGPYSSGVGPGPVSGFNIEVTDSAAGKPTELTVTVPSNFDEDLWGQGVYASIYIARERSIVRKRTFPMEVERETYWRIDLYFRAYDGNAPSGPPDAPTVFNIDGTSAQFSCPNPLLADYIAYRPEFYDPTVDGWFVAGIDCHGGEVITAEPLIPETAGYKVRFVGIPDPASGAGEVNGYESSAFTTDEDTGPTECSAYPLGKKISSEYKDMLNQSPTTRALLMKVTRLDGEVFAYTTASYDIDGSDVLEDGSPIPQLNGVTFLAKGGITPTNVAGSVDVTKADNLDIEALIEDDAITVRDIEAGLFEGAAVLLCEVNYKDLTQGVMRHKKGYIGEISYDENRFRGEVVSLASKLKNPILEETSVLCRVKRFMDSRCNVQPNSQTLDGYDVTRTGTVSAVDSTDAGRVLTIPAADDIPDGYYNYGRLTVTSPLSPNKDVERKIRKHTGAVIELAERLPFDVEVGDTVSLVVGCDRRIETCSQRFGNAVNFRGEPHTPGVDIYTVVSS